MTRSFLLFHAWLDTEDPRFLREVFACEDEAFLGELARGWYADKRPFARAALLRWIEDGGDRPGHRALFKHLLKDAEEADDGEVLVGLLVAADRMTLHSLTDRYTWDWIEERYERWTARRRPDLPLTVQAAGQAKRFTLATRRYLQRRTLRWLRGVGKRDLARYRELAGLALRSYRDAHLPEPHHLLDAWSLCHLLYWGEPRLKRTWDRGVLPAAARFEPELLDSLQAAPLHPDAFADPEATFQLILQAEARVVRRGLIDLWTRRHPEHGQQLDPARVLHLLVHRAPELQRLGAELVERRERLGDLSLDWWLRALEVTDLEAAARLTPLAAARLGDGASLALADLLRLACSPAAPVAELAWGWVQRRAGDAPLDQLAALTTARSPSIRAEAALWLAARLEERPDARPEDARDLLDAPDPTVRAAGIALALRSPRYAQAPQLWAAMSESPFPDVREALVTALDRLGPVAEGPLSDDALRRVLITTVLGVHRGSRARRAALRAIADRLSIHPAEADALLPLLLLAVRSAHPAEQHAALAALATSLHNQPKPLYAALQRLASEVAPCS